MRVAAPLLGGGGRRKELQILDRVTASSSSARTCRYQSVYGLYSCSRVNSEVNG